MPVRMDGLLLFWGLLLSLQLLFLFPVVLVTCNLCMLVVSLSCGLKFLVCNVPGGLGPWVALLDVENLVPCCWRCAWRAVLLGLEMFLFLLL
jgi:hypothetical protein